MIKIIIKKNNMENNVWLNDGSNTFKENDRVRIKLKTNEEYIGQIYSIQNNLVVLKCAGDLYNLEVSEIEIIRFAKISETFENA